MFPWKARDLFVDNIKGGRKKKNYGTYEMHCLVLTK